MINRKNKIFFGIFIFSILSVRCGYAQASIKGSKQANDQMYIVDTVYYSNPIFIYFVEGKGRLYGSGTAIFDKSKVIINDSIINKGYMHFIKYVGDKFLLIDEFENLLGNYKYNSPNPNDSTNFFFVLGKNILKLQHPKYLKMISETISVSDNLNYTYYHMEVNKFLVVLVKNKLLQQNNSSNDFRINGFDNYYIKILVPMIW